MGTGSRSGVPVKNHVSLLVSDFARTPSDAVKVRGRLTQQPGLNPLRSLRLVVASGRSLRELKDGQTFSHDGAANVGSAARGDNQFGRGEVPFDPLERPERARPKSPLRAADVDQNILVHQCLLQKDKDPGKGQSGCPGLESVTFTNVIRARGPRPARTPDNGRAQSRPRP